MSNAKADASAWARLVVGEFAWLLAAALPAVTWIASAGRQRHDG